MTPSQRRSLGTLFIVALLCSASACSDKRTNLGDPDAAMPGGGNGSGGSGGSGSGDGDGDGDGTGGSSTGDGDGDGDIIDGGQATNPDGGTTFPDGGMIPDELLLCNGVACMCLDGIDNDGDGEVDGFDTECTGANDNDEGSFATGIPGDNSDPKWQDCFFDGNSGAGDDDCRYSTDCLTGDLPQDDKDCTLTDQCVEFCSARTPNGCDCFGCCEITKDDGEVVHVVIAGTCSEETIDDCTPCVQTTSDCTNECGRCELCLGKTREDLPEDCFEQPPTGGSGGSGGTGGNDGSYCDNGLVACESQSDCGEFYYCSLGCCLAAGPT